MSSFDLMEHPHRRYNPLTREWVLVSPHRTHRPWLGQVEKLPPDHLPAYDPSCYMCPGNTRATGARNPGYENTFVFDNDYPALLSDIPSGGLDVKGLIVASSEAGICRVVCFSPKHDLTVSQMPVANVHRVVEEWVRQYQQLGTLPFINYVQIFENRGAMMGASNPHPHCQCWGSASVPNEPFKEQIAQKDYLASHNHCLLCDYLVLERRSSERIIFENQHFCVIVPFWAVWPFETVVLPTRHLSSMDEMSRDEQKGLAEALKHISARYDHLFDVPFPYSMGFHQRPTDTQSHAEWHMHAHFYPPLLRSATVRKFMVGYEMLGTPQRDITPEMAATRLRDMQK